MKPSATMGWHDKSPESKAEECEDCKQVLESGERYNVCIVCGHLFTGRYCNCYD